MSFASCIATWTLIATCDVAFGVKSTELPSYIYSTLLLLRLQGSHNVARFSASSREYPTTSNDSIMNVLLLGSGGREHAIAIAFAKSPWLETLFVAPGNPGIASIARMVALDIKDHPAVAAFCKANHIDLVVVGPEAPLVGGIVDGLAAEGIKPFGPSRAAARLEGSKAFAKEFCTRFKIPTAPYARFAGAAPAKTYVRG